MGLEREGPTQAGTAQTRERQRAKEDQEDELRDLGWGDCPGPHTPPTEGAGHAAAPSSRPPAAPCREPRTPACLSHACLSLGTMVCGRDGVCGRCPMVRVHDPTESVPSLSGQEAASVGNGEGGRGLGAGASCVTWCVLGLCSMDGVKLRGMSCLMNYMHFMHFSLRENASNGEI